MIIVFVAIPVGLIGLIVLFSFASCCGYQIAVISPKTSRLDDDTSSSSGTIGYKHEYDVHDDESTDNRPSEREKEGVFNLHFNVCDNYLYTTTTCYYYIHHDTYIRHSLNPRTTRLIMLFPIQFQPRQSSSYTWHCRSRLMPGSHNLKIPASDHVFTNSPSKSNAWLSCARN